MAHPHPDQLQRFWALSFCTLRSVKITNPFWTYCQNFAYGKRDISTIPPQPAKGWISASGLYEGYVRIPWHDNVEPAVSVPCKCSTCGRDTPRGITVATESGTVGFCTNRHYVEWWLTKHRDPAVNPDSLATPEEFYKT